MSMTPERIEEIKNVAGISDEWALEKIVNELLAALEESHQEQEYAKQQAIYWNDEAVKIKRQLAETQQIIDRQAKVMKEAGIVLNAAQLLALFIEKDGKPVDGFRFREIARNMMTLLELMDWSALGNKEGNDKELQSTREGGECTCVDCGGLNSSTWVCKQCQDKRDRRYREGKS